MIEEEVSNIVITNYKINEKIKNKWINKINSFCSKPKYYRIKFPLKMTSTIGELYSVLGLLCEVHKEEMGGSWNVIKGEKGKIDIILGYENGFLVPPESVLKWAEIDRSFCSHIISICSDDDFEGVVSFLSKK